MFQFFGVTGTYEGSGGGSINIVNGIIEQYKASTETISANKFVEFVNNFTSTGTKISSTSSTYYYTIAILIDTNKVFVLHCGSGTTTTTIVYGAIYTISGNTIILNTDTQLATLSNSYSFSIVATLIDTNKVFVVFSNNDKLYGTVCTISEDIITWNTEYLIFDSSGGYSFANTISTTLIDTNKFLVTHRGSSNKLYGIVCTISENIITIGEDTEINSDYNCYPMSTTLISTNKVFLGVSNSSFLNGIVCTISGTTITVGTSVRIASSTYAYQYATATLVDTNKVFVSFRGSSSYLYGIVCTISGTTITVGTQTQLSSLSNSYEYATTILLNTNKIFILHRGGSYLYGIVCTISGTAILVGLDTQLSSSSNSYHYNYPVLINGKKVLVNYRNSKELYAKICIIEAQNIFVAPLIKSSSSEIHGLLVTEATTSTAGDVWILNN